MLIALLGGVLPNQSSADGLPAFFDSPKLVGSSSFAASIEAGNEEFSVIVRLNDATPLESFSGWADPDLVNDYRLEVSSQLNNFLGSLPSGVEVGHLYKNLAAFSARVSLEELQWLIDSRDVRRAEFDRSLTVATDQGITLMEADIPRSDHDGAGVSIAIVDTGVRPHPALGGNSYPNSKLIGGFDFVNGGAPFDFSGHGTSMAGLAAGNIVPNGDYVGGVAPGAKIYALKVVSNGESTALASDIIAAWDWAVVHQSDDPANPIRLISSGFSGDVYPTVCDDFESAFADAAFIALVNDIAIFSPAGNGGWCMRLGSPACVGEVISVGAVYDSDLGVVHQCTDGPSGSEICVGTPFGGCSSGWRCTDGTTQADQVSCNSNSAWFLDLLAPSNHATAPTWPGGYDTQFGGTSAACAYAVGAAAVLLNAANDLGVNVIAADLRSRLTATGDPVTDAKSAVTTPRVNLTEAVNNLEEYTWIWVDFSHTGAETGSMSFPFDTLGEGVSAADIGGTVAIRSGTSPETLTIDKDVIILAVDGPATIGQ